MTTRSRKTYGKMKQRENKGAENKQEDMKKRNFRTLMQIETKILKGTSTMNEKIKNVNEQIKKTLTKNFQTPTKYLKILTRNLKKLSRN